MPSVQCAVQQWQLSGNFDTHANLSVHVLAGAYPLPNSHLHQGEGTSCEC